MSERERQLQASINGHAVGVLREVNGLWSFQYDVAWRHVVIEETVGRTQAGQHS